jgi:hypothetical protein
VVPLANPENEATALAAMFGLNMPTTAQKIAAQDNDRHITLCPIGSISPSAVITLWADRSTHPM